MTSVSSDSHDTNTQILKEIHERLLSLQDGFQRLSISVEAVENRVDSLIPSKQVPAIISQQTSTNGLRSPRQRDGFDSAVSSRPTSPGSNYSSSVERKSFNKKAPNATSSKIILTTYPGQSGIDPVPLVWGHVDPIQRGPVIVSRGKSTVRRRNAIGAHGGSYSIYYALAVASNSVDVEHKPDFTNTEPAVHIGPFRQWSDPKKIVSMDPLGHRAPEIYRDLAQSENVDIRPTIAVTKAHMKLPELEQSVLSGRLIPDGKICLNGSGELAVTKFAVEPVWYLPGVAERFGIGQFPRFVRCQLRLFISFILAHD